MDHKLKDFSNIVVAAFSDKGTVRDNNEDNLFASVVDVTNANSADTMRKKYSLTYPDEPMIFAVFDGIGGTYGGEIVSLCAANVLSEMETALLSTDCDKLPDAMAVFKDRVEKDILSEEGFTAKNMPGTTCCAFIVRGGKVVPFWIGDSRVYMLRGNKLILLTKDHTVAQEKIDYGVISPEEASSISGWHHLTAYIGDLHSKFSIGSEFTLEPGDKFLLCSDGISDKYKAEDIANYMNCSVDECLDLFEKGVKIESKDNATALLVEFNTSEHHSFSDTIIKKTRECFDSVIEKGMMRKHE